MRIGIRTVTYPLLALAAMASLTARAQTEASTSSQTSSESQLQVITVTATRRSESVQKVPISVEALSQADLNRLQIKSIADIAAVTPGLQFTAPIAPATITTISIRGTNTQTGPSTVGVYLDDTPLQGRLSPLGNVGSPYPVVFDLQRVEVLRGPQGTLFGAGSEGGTVRFITNEPSLTEFSGITHAEVATTENGAPSYELGAAAGGPIDAGKIGFRASAWTRQDGGYVDLVDPLTGTSIRKRNENGDDKSAFRLALAFLADGFRITPSMYYQSLHFDDNGRFYFFNGPDGTYSDPSHGYFANAAFQPESWTDTFWVPAVQVKKSLSFADLTSTTSYTHRDVRDTLDFSTVFFLFLPNPAVGFGSPIGPDVPTSLSDAAPTVTGQRTHAITEEIRLASNRPDALVTWVAGIFFDHRSQEDYQSTTSLIVDPTGADVFNVDQRFVDQQIAAFGQADVHLTKKLSLTLGERVARVRTEYYVASNGAGFSGVPFSLVAPTATETPTTPRMALTYQATRNDMLYASVSKGFRIGGDNFPLPSNCGVVAQPYKPDDLWNYEVGAKNGLFDNRLQLDTSLFHYKWYNIQQLTSVPCGLSYTTNSGDAVGNGFDLWLHALPTDRLQVTLNLGYVDAYYTKDAYDSFGNLLVAKDDKIGLTPQVISPWNATLAMDYRIPSPRSGDDILLHADYIYDSRNPGPFVTQNKSSVNYLPHEVADPPIHLMNLRLGYVTGGLDAGLYVDNVFNSHPLLSKLQGLMISTVATYSTLRPRTIGISGTYSF
jgi:iron complex outermembrane receptor protein